MYDCGTWNRFKIQYFLFGICTLHTIGAALCHVLGGVAGCRPAFLVGSGVQIKKKDPGGIILQISGMDRTADQNKVQANKGRGRPGRAGFRVSELLLLLVLLLLLLRLLLLLNFVGVFFG